MSGHSKWANIKHKKAKGDAAKAAIFTKMGREIAVAVKNGGSDPATNSKLFDVIAKAKANNIPNDNIARSIKKASGELGTVNYEEMVYEGYGTNGVAVIVEALTDNKNRTAGEVRHLFDKFGGSLGTTGSVSFMFEKKGLLVVEKSSVKLSEDEVMELALEAGADDFKADDEMYEIYTSPQDFYAVSKALESKLEFLSNEITMIPSNYVTLDNEQRDKFLRMLEKMEENEDIQNVYHNADYEEEAEEE